MRSQWLVRTFLAVWASSLTVVGACLMVNHWVPLPGPEFSEVVLDGNLINDVDGRWTALHFLYADCACSRRVLEHVLTQPTRTDVRERIVLIGGDAELAARAARRGSAVDQVSPEQLKSRYGVEAAPFLLVVDPHGQVRYSGGYTTRKQGFANQYNQIIADLLAGIDVPPLPVYGCAVSRGLKSIIDPLGIKPSNKE